MVKYIFVTLAILFMSLEILTSRAQADTVMYCSAELSTGIFEENGSYDTTAFKKDRYAVKVTGDFDEVLIGANFFDCRHSFDMNFRPHERTCFHAGQIHNGSRVSYGGLPLVFFYNQTTKRYIYFQASVEGYAGKSSDTDSMDAGICEDF